MAIVGVLCALDDVFERYKAYISKANAVKKCLISCGVLLVLLVALQLRFRIEQFWDVLETIGVVCICMLECTIISRIPVVRSVLSYVGKHSMNMFLTHTFVFEFWFREFTFSFRYPLLILTVLVIDTLLISVVIEWLKKLLHVDQFTKFIYNSIRKPLFAELSMDK